MAKEFYINKDLNPELLGYCEELENLIIKKVKGLNSVIINSHTEQQLFVEDFTRLLTIEQYSLYEVNKRGNLYILDIFNNEFQCLILLNNEMVYLINKIQEFLIEA